RYVKPRLTTIRYPIQMMAEKAALLALQLSKDETLIDESPKRYSPTMVKRDSVTAVNAPR
ncbi:MAG: DNA-binding transcriptional regulator GalS, partial [Vibrio sp.]